MKRIELLSTAILVPVDYLALVLAGWTAYSLRIHQLAEFRPVLDTISRGEFMRGVFLAALVWLALLASTGIYHIGRHRLTSEYGRIVIGTSLGFVVLVLMIFFQRDFFASRFILLAGWVISIFYIWIAHTLVRGIQRILLGRGVGIHRIVVIGKDQTTDELLESFRTQKGQGYLVVATYPDITLETLEKIREWCAGGSIQEVIQSDATIPKAQTMQLIELCHEHAVTFRYAADTFDTHTGRFEIQDVAGVALIEMKRTPLEGWGRISKRLLDIVGALFGIILFSIPGLIVAICIKLDSSGPVFIQLERVGQGQRRFRLWKFRSMIPDAHAMKQQLLAQNERGDGPLFKLTNDPRITRVGRFIRKTSIDELPQLFNVLGGSMSLVGPRPHEPEEVAKYERHHKKVLAIKPGMTGMAQVSGRSQLSFEEEVRLDTYYIEHWSLPLDIQIIVRTPIVVLTAKTAA